MYKINVHNQTKVRSYRKRTVDYVHRLIEKLDKVNTYNKEENESKNTSKDEHCELKMKSQRRHSDLCPDINTDTIPIKKLSKSPTVLTPSHDLQSNSIHNDCDSSVLLNPDVSKSLQNDTTPQSESQHDIDLEVPPPTLLQRSDIADILHCDIPEYFNYEISAETEFVI